MNFYIKTSDALKSTNQIGNISKSNSVSTLNSVNNNRPSYLFKYLFENAGLNKYPRDENMDVHWELIKEVKQIKINDIKLPSIYWQAAAKYDLDYGRHQFIVGWGNKKDVRFEGKDAIIPFYSLLNRDDRKDYRIRAGVFNRWPFQENVDTGYFVIWRDVIDYKDSGKSKLGNKILSFLPSESQSLIPVDSGLEMRMIQYLIQNKIPFKKPLVYFDDSNYIPDFIIKTKNGEMLLEVAGRISDIEYYKNLKRKEKYYMKRGYPYVIWEGTEDLECFFKKHLQL